MATHKKTYLYIISSLLTCVVNLSAQVQSSVGIERGARINGFSTERSGKSLLVQMNFDLSSVNVKSNNELVLTPVIRKGKDSVVLAPVVVAGRNRYYHFMRKNHELAEGAMLYREGRQKTVDYKAVVPYEKWMAGAGLYADWRDDGCCTDPVTGMVALTDFHFEPKKFVPRLLYVQPPVVEKEDSAERTAHIIFIVDKTNINYARPQNIEELGKIRRTIDSLKNDRDYTITSLTVKGYASPESPYEHNRELAEGRTETLKRYIMEQCGFPYGMIATSAVPEDWDGLERYVERSGLPNREAILALIKMGMDPDKKEQLIKQTFPEDYRYMLANFYPDLRRSEYKVRYKIRHFTDINEILRMLQTEPGKLGLDELYMAAKTMPQGSDEFARTFKMAVVMYPDAPLANLNAANVAMERGNLDEAKRYLDKAGNSAQALYAKGVFAALTEQYDEAETLFRLAAGGGVTEAADALIQLADIKGEL